ERVDEPVPVGVDDGVRRLQRHLDGAHVGRLGVARCRCAREADGVVARALQRLHLGGRPVGDAAGPLPAPVLLARPELMPGRRLLACAAAALVVAGCSTAPTASGGPSSGTASAAASPTSPSASPTSDPADGVPTAPPTAPGQSARLLWSSQGS